MAISAWRFLARSFPVFAGATGQQRLGIRLTELKVQRGEVFINSTELAEIIDFLIQYVRLMMSSCGKKILVEYKYAFCGSLSSLKAGALDRNPLYTEPEFIQSNEKYSKGLLEKASMQGTPS